MRARTVLWVAAIPVMAVLLLLGGLALLYLSTPDPSPLAGHDPATTSWIQRVRASGRTVIWLPVPLDRISPDLVLAILVAEDVRFFDHHGFDPYEIRAAIRDALGGKRLRGASTITQQLARNLWLSNERTAGRKLREAVLAWKIEHSLSKRRILELYLNTAFFGHGAFGVEAASLVYFHVSSSELTREQAARLAATLPAPTRWYPGSDSPRAERHFRRILRRMQLFAGLRERL